MLGHDWRIDQLSDAFFVAAGEEDEVVGGEGEGGRAPGEGLLEFRCCGHGIVGLNGCAGCALVGVDVVSVRIQDGCEEVPTKSFRVMPRSIFLSHSGVLPFSVAKWTSKPAFLKAMYGMLVSVGS